MWNQNSIEGDSIPVRAHLPSKGRRLGPVNSCLLPELTQLRQTGHKHHQRGGGCGVGCGSGRSQQEGPQFVGGSNIGPRGEGGDGMGEGGRGGEGRDGGERGGWEVGAGGGGYGHGRRLEDANQWAG